MKPCTHTLHDQTFELLPEKALIWKETNTLVLADLHLGKATHFRKAGIGIPLEVETANLDKLAQLLLDHPVQRILILGDLFHSHHNAAWEEFKDFLSKFPTLPFLLVKGNHDILPEAAYEADNLKVYDEELQEGPFLFTHIPLEKAQEGLYNVCGHLHPGVVLRGKGRQSLKLPCFHFMQHSLIVPAFGAFTGTARISSVAEDEVYAISDTQVIKVL